jgi:hypothetical protein
LNNLRENQIEALNLARKLASVPAAFGYNAGIGVKGNDGCGPV